MIYFCGNSTPILFDIDDKRKKAAQKKNSSIEYVLENRIFTVANNYSMVVKLPLADWQQNLGIYVNAINPTDKTTIEDRVGFP